MPLSHEEFQEHLNQLNDPELSAEDRTDVLTKLRDNNTSTLQALDETTATNEKLKTSNDDLTRANARLFNETGFMFRDNDNTNGDGKEEEPEKIPTLEEIEAQYRQH